MGNKQNKPSESKNSVTAERPRTGSVYARLEGNAEVGRRLKKVPILAGFNEEQRAKLGALLEYKTYKSNSLIIRQGDKGDGFYIIISGKVSVFTESDGQRNVISTLKGGDYFGESAITSENGIRGANVESLSSLECFYLSRENFNLFTPGITFARRQGVTEGFGRKSQGTQPKGVPEPSPKSAQESADIEEATHGNLLFDNLTLEQRQAVVEAMFQRKVAAGTRVISQGEPGDCFYVVQAGTLDILVKDKVVAMRGPKSCFGELALLYNAPRAATVVAMEDCVLWAVHRSTFRSIVRDWAREKYHVYVGFLKDVPLLAPLSAAEREIIADALEEHHVPANTVVFKQGSEGDKMYIVYAGEVEVAIDGKLVSSARAGDYFGEKALLTGEARAGTVTTTKPTTLISLDKEQFALILGPLQDIVCARVASYSMDPDRMSMAVTEAPNRSIPFESLRAVAVLGKGSFGYVRLVRDIATGMTYALKAVNKQMIVDTGQQGHIMSEKNTMLSLAHPFVIKLYQTYQDDHRLYFLLEPALGGELFTILRQRTRFSEDEAQFYAAQVVCAFDYMHARSIVYRDLKPENLLVNKDGYIKFIDFGFAKKLKTVHTYTLCGTPDYLAPEIVTGKGHGFGVDWWCVGILIYEMIGSFPPFVEDDPMLTYQKIIDGRIEFPHDRFSENAKKIIKAFTDHNPSRRLGMTKAGTQAIRDHKWFQSLDFGRLLEKKITPPIIPEVKGESDTSNFDPVEDPDEVPPYTDNGSGWDDDF